MMSANGNLDFFNSEWVVGTAFIVDRIYLGEQFASGDCVTLAYYEELAHGVQYIRQTAPARLTFGGRMQGGGGKSSSETLKG